MFLTLSVFAIKHFSREVFLTLNIFDSKRFGRCVFDVKRFRPLSIFDVKCF